MAAHSREKKVLVVLGISIALGAVVLNALGHNPPSAGAFCLSRYNRLGSVKKYILSRAEQSSKLWSRIEIYYSGTESGNIESAYGVPDGVGKADGEQNEKVSTNGLNCHFVICNGNGGRDGLIQPTEKWQRQSPVLTRPNRDGEPVFRDTLEGQTIYICVIADNKAATPTNFQIKRTEELVEGLCRKFDIQPESIIYPR
jgi:hypothetical protein